MLAMAPRFDAVVLGDLDALLAEAVALAGGRIVDGSSDPGTLIVLNATGAQDVAQLLSASAGVDVAIFGPEQIDQVADALLLTDAALLCAPSIAELIAALALAARAPDTAGVREGEAARLRRFGEEVARIAAVLARLAASETVADRRPTFDAGPDARSAEIEVEPQPIRAMLRARRLRDGFFGEGLFEEPAWDMLLDLFAAELEGAQVSVSSLCIAAAVAPTTALRWIGRLAADGWFERRDDPRDRRRAFIALSRRGSAAMRGYWAALARAGLAVG